MTGCDEGMYRRLVETSPEGVVLVDAQNPEHPVIYVNSAFEALTGYSAANSSAEICACCRATIATRTAANGCARH